jgi:hypothetical protein
MNVVICIAAMSVATGSTLGAGVWAIAAPLALIAINVIAKIHIGVDPELFG